MQNSPSHVKICTHASRFIVDGISFSADNTSRVLPASPLFCAFIRLNSARFSGGYSFVVNTVHNTAIKMAAAPT